MTDGSQSDLKRMDRALIQLRHFFEAPAVLDDDSPRVELSTLLVLDAIARCHIAPTVSEVAERLDVTHSTASRLIARAEAVGMVIRATSPKDKRATYIEATQAGRELARRATRHRLARLATLTEEWTAAETENFSRLLARFTTAAQGQRKSCPAEVPRS